MLRQDKTTRLAFESELLSWILEDGFVGSGQQVHSLQNGIICPTRTGAVVNHDADGSNSTRNTNERENVNVRLNSARTCLGLTITVPKQFLHNVNGWWCRRTRYLVTCELTTHYPLPCVRNHTKSLRYCNAVAQGRRELTEALILSVFLLPGAFVYSGLWIWILKLWMIDM